MGLVTDTALREPVTITRRGRPSLVVTSVQDYQALQRLKYSKLKR
jgi:prevent-host-death family protein